ncbi:MAG TPA: hypothetical protein DEO98_02550 [Legionellales bacterium]|nr:hypothetical protein [Legionellales bacterium]|tara:strand:- start:1022 stop:3106 length:2085 start_codon:yes stop_codon:yes gene_type:complete
MNVLPIRFVFKKNALPCIRQVELTECAQACVAMVGIFHGHQLSLESVRQWMPSSLHGTSLHSISQALDKLDLQTRAIKIDISGLGYLPCPAILHWQANHFVVLKSVHKHHIIIHDPAQGVCKVPIAQATQAFTGIAMEITKKAQFIPCHDTQKLSIWDLFKQIAGLKYYALLLLWLSFAIEVLSLINPLFIQYVTDSVVGAASLPNMYVVVAGFLLITLIHTLSEYMRSHLVVYVTNHLAEYFSTGIMRHLMSLPYQYFEKRHQGDILSRVYAINEIQHKVTSDSINALLDGLVIICAFIIMCWYSFILSLWVIGSLLIYLSLRVVAYQHHAAQTKASINAHADMNAKLLEIVKNMMTIKLYQKEHTLFSRWHQYFITARNAEVRISYVNIVYNVANILLFNVEHILVIALGAMLVVRHQFSMGMLMAFLAYRQSLVNKSSSFIQKFFDYKLLTVQLERVADILLHTPEKSQKTLLVANHAFKGELSVQNLSFSYQPEEPLLIKHLSFHIKPGEKVAITGASGTGKTTLLKIILGLLPPSSGQILIDNIPLATLGLSHYRQHIAAVMQDDTLVSGSILDNIVFLDDQVDLTRVLEVSRIAQLHDAVLAMPMGYETMIGDLGSALSGGQKQRLMIARALYKNPKILFFDEATSHLDVATEQKLNQALKQLCITQFIIAHREASIKMADRIIHIED